MSTKVLGAISSVLLCSAVLAQQANTVYATMTINGVVGPPYPIQTNVRTSTIATFALSGATNQPYAIFQAPLLGVGSAFFPANNSLNSVDLALNPLPALVIDGFANPVFKTNGTGNGGFGIAVPTSGLPPNGVPLGMTLSLQAAVADPVSSLGVTLTAATRITVTQGPIITNLNLGNEGSYVLSTAANPIPFYGAYYSSMTIYANGYIMIGASPPSDYTPSPAAFIASSPRVAGFWADLDQNLGTIVVTVDVPQGTPPGQTPGFVRVDYTNVQEWGITVSHTFSLLLRTDGTVEIIEPASQNAAAAYDQITGIGPGNSLGLPQPQQNFVGADPDGGGSQTTGILTTPPTFSKIGATNEAFYEWFGNFSLPNYGNTYVNSFDLFASTLHFLPNGTGSLPQATTGYTLY